MPLSRESLERQLVRAEAELKHVAAGLKEQGVPEKEITQQAKWKQAKSIHRKVKSRLMAVSAKEQLQSQKAAEE